jgi:hypothetical protein
MNGIEVSGTGWFFRSCDAEGTYTNFHLPLLDANTFLIGGLSPSFRHI